MRRLLTSRDLALMLGMVLALSLLVFPAGLSPALPQEPGPMAAPARSVTKQTTGRYLGPVSCASSNCHGSVRPRSLFDVKQNEYFIWLKQDKHSRSYEVLLDERSTLIARNLKLQEEAHESPRCLSCHALSVESNSRSISCESCHGPASGWIAQHTENGWTHEMSVNAGMTDLRNLVTRAQTCLGCHMGNDQNSVDHALIAAGHPDLVFELDNYSAAMPAHWMTFRERREKGGREETDGPRAWAVGQVVSLRQALLLITHRTGSRQWPEFADMDCYGCHHSLEAGKQRKTRRSKSSLGLPRWSLAQFAVSRHLASLFAAEEIAGLNRGVRELSSQIARINTPRGAVASTAELMAQTMERVVQKVSKATVDRAVAGRLAQMIAGDVPYLADTDIRSATQAVMAINALVSSLARDDPSLAEGGPAQAIDNLYRDVEAPESFDADRFGKHMAELQRFLK